MPGLHALILLIHNSIISLVRLNICNCFLIIKHLIQGISIIATIDTMEDRQVPGSELLHFIFELPSPVKRRFIIFCQFRSVDILPCS